jgi:hypothetical protein
VAAVALCAGDQKHVNKSSRISFPICKRHIKALGVVLFPCSFILRKALGAKPALIGNKGLRIPYFKGENWFEVDIDVDSDSQARNITGMVIGATKSLVVDIAFLIESQLQEVQPRVSNLD